MLNRTDLASPLGVSVPTLSHWLSILETTGVILLTRSTEDSEPTSHCGNQPAGGHVPRHDVEPNVGS